MDIPGAATTTTYCSLDTVLLDNLFDNLFDNVLFGLNKNGEQRQVKPDWWVVFDRTRRLR